MKSTHRRFWLEVAQELHNKSRELGRLDPRQASGNNDIIVAQTAALVASVLASALLRGIEQYNSVVRDLKECDEEDRA